MSWQEEISENKRFEFGKNWSNFLKKLDPKKIEHSENMLKTMLDEPHLEGKTFLDIGSGSGLHSLAAKKLGAQVFSFDYDSNSVACTQYLKDTFYKNDGQWTVTQGSALEEQYIQSLGTFDVVYSWGVLHHTGQMWHGLDLASIPVKENGKLYIAIYNTQIQTPIWRIIKKTYVSSPKLIQNILNIIFMIYFSTGLFIADVLRGINPLRRHTDLNRGMVVYNDAVDWIGGYPFETAKPEEILDFYKSKGFVLDKMITVGGKMGCNEFVFRKCKCTEL